MRSVKRPNQSIPPPHFQEEVARLWPVQRLWITASSITLSSEAFILVSAATAVTLTLPKVSQSHGAYFTVVNATNSNVLISGLTGENINGSASYTIASQYVAVSLIGDNLNTRWIVFSIRT